MTTPELPPLPPEISSLPRYAREEIARRERILLARIAELTADRDAARRERDEAIEAKESAELETAYLANEMVYEGNSIGWIASKAKNYGAALMDAWAAVKAIGGKCDGLTPLHEAIRQQLVAKTAIDAAREAKP